MVTVPRVRSSAVLLGLLILKSASLGAQQPDTAAAPRKHRIPAEAAIQDTVSRPVAAPQDTGAVPPDTAQRDTTPALFPRFPLPSGLAPGTVAEWDHTALMSTGLLSPAQLLDLRSPLDAVRAGFLEGPEVLDFAGTGPPSLRVLLDGYELRPLDGSALDLHSLGLVDIGRARLIHEPGGYLLGVEPYRRDRRAAYSRIEGGTGDRNTNLLRGYFDSEFLDSPVSFGFDRIDTNGQASLGGSNRTLVTGTFSRSLLAGIWGQLQFRRSTVDREAGPAPQRTDWILRLRRPFASGWFADVVAGAASRKEDVESAMAAGRLPRITARQVAVRGARTSEHLRASLTLRAWDGNTVPDFEPEAAVEMEAGPTTFFASGRYTSWSTFDTRSGYAGVTVKLPFGLQAVAEGETGDRGLARGTPEGGQVSFDRWTVGGVLRQLGWTLSVRGGRWRQAPSPGLGAPFDSAAALSGGRVGVFEASAMGRLFRLLGGSVEVGGAFRSREAGAFLYWPQQEWRAQGLYHTVAMDGQLEVRLEALGGVRAGLRSVDRTSGAPIFVLGQDLSWFWGEVSVRIKDVHLFYDYWFYDALGGPQDVPGLPLPRAQTIFGLKWEFWN